VWGVGEETFFMHGGENFFIGITFLDEKLLERREGIASPHFD